MPGTIFTSAMSEVIASMLLLREITFYRTVFLTLRLESKDPRRSGSISTAQHFL